MATKLPSETPTGYDEMRTNIKGLHKRLSDIQELGIAQFTPLVERIINTLDPAATVDYINAYREMWDSETLEVKT